MEDKNTSNDKGQIDHHIFNGSIALIAVCITVISLFRVTKTGTETVADDIMGVATIVFITSTFLSYLSLRKSRHYIFERIADVCFFGGLLLMFFAVVIILFNI